MWWIAEACIVPAGLILPCLAALAAVCSCAKQVQNAVNQKINIYSSLH